MTTYSIDSAAVQESADFLIQYLRDTGFTGSIENGTALYDQVIVPIGLLFSLFRTELKKTQAYLSLDSAVTLSAELGEDTSDAIDAVLSNWFVSRNSGTAASGVLNLVFSTPQSYLAFTNGTTYFYIDGVPFTVASDVVVTSSDFVPTANTVNNTTEYTLQLNVVAQEYQSMVVGTAKTVVNTIDNIYLLRVAPAGTFASGSDQESDDDFIARTEKVINTRELISDRAITTVLLDSIADLKDVFVAGYGHEAQLRDIKEFDNITVHVGNKADIYCSVNLQKAYVDIPYADDTVTEYTLSDYTDGLPVVDVLSAEDLSEHTKYVKLYFADDTESVSLSVATDILSISGYEYALAQDYTITAEDFEADTYGGIVCKSVIVELDYSLMLAPVVAGNIAEFESTVDDLLGALTVFDTSDGGDLYPVTMSSEDEGLFGAANQSSVCSIQPLSKDVSGTMRIHYLTHPSILEAYDLVYSEDQRVTNHDPAVKSAYPIQLSVDLEVLTSTAVDVSDVREAIVSYVRSVRMGNTLSVSTMVKNILVNVLGVTSVTLPVTVTYRFRDPLSAEYITGSVTDRFSLPEEVYSAQIHIDTIGFHVDNDDISVTVTQEI